jgi:hypothetical protein
MLFETLHEFLSASLVKLRVAFQICIEATRVTGRHYGDKKSECYVADIYFYS